MILLDLNQVLLSTLFASVGKHTNVEVNEDLFRHMTMNTIRSINSKFRNEYGELIVCCDSINNWRREYFPYYKAARKKIREDSDINWPVIFESLEKIKIELAKYFPYRFIQIDGAEADDIIGVLARENFSDEKILIISGDKDFKQLQRNPNVRQFDNINKLWLVDDNPEEFLKEHIIKGDLGDGIPNILSDDNVFVINSRQKKLTQKRKDSLQNIENEPNNKYYRNYIRNKTLIDLTQTPNDLVEKIIHMYNAQQGKNRSKLMDYFIEFKLKTLVEKIGDF